MKCLRCEAETYNENQLCDACQEAESANQENLEQVEPQQETPEQEVVVEEVAAGKKEKKAKNGKGKGILALVFALIAIALFFFSGIIFMILNIVPSIIGLVPIIGPIVSRLIKFVFGLVRTFNPIICFVLSIAAIVLGSKAKQTPAKKAGKAGKALGIVMVIIIPILAVVKAIFKIILTIFSLFIAWIILVMLMGPTLIPLIAPIQSIIGEFLYWATDILAELCSSLPVIPIPYDFIIDIIEMFDPILADILEEFFEALLGHMPNLIQIGRMFLPF